MKNGKNDNTLVKKVVNEETGEERNVILQLDHAKPTTRRQFLANGMIGVSGTLVLPSILNVLARPEFAMADEDQCGSSSSGGLPAYITVNLAGGSSLAFNLLPLARDRQPLAAYNLVGGGNNQAVHSDTTGTLGTDLFQGVRVTGNQTTAVNGGFFWLGLKATAGAAINNTSVFNICVQSHDDTSSNTADASGMILAAGLSGSLLPGLGQRSSTGTGVGQMAAIIPPGAPLNVGSFATIEGALRPAGTLGTRLTESRRKKLLDLVNSLSGSQARAVASAGTATGEALAKVVECATGKNVEISGKADPGIDPGLNTDMASIWGIAANNKNSGNYVPAAMTFNVLKGNAPLAGIDMGGFDYHGATRDQQNAADQRAGEMVGRILASARALNRPMMIHVVTDGSVSAGGNEFASPFTNDSGTQGMSYIFAFNPFQRPKQKNDQFKHQIGHFTAGQGAATASVVGNTTKAAAAVVANYLALAGQASKISSIAPGVFTSNDLNEVIRIDS